MASLPWNQEDVLYTIELNPLWAIWQCGEEDAPVKLSHIADANI